MSVTQVLGSIGSELVKVVLGSHCIVCEEELPVRRRVASCCVDCWSGLPCLPRERCRGCAVPLPGAGGPAGATCLRCITEPLATSWIDSWGRYDSGLTKVLQAFKFGGQSFLSGPLSDLLAAALFSRTAPRFDMIVAVPMTIARERSRGYNQASLLAESLSKRVGLRLETRLLRKTEERRTQSELGKAERRANVEGTFEAGPDARGARILVVDDICTTGETLSACASVLRRAGATDVAAVTVARTP